METYLSFQSFSSLLTYLNIILVAIVVFFTMNKFVYIINTIVYAIAKTFIPIITSLIFSSFLGGNVTISIGAILILLILYFMTGLIVIKIIEKITDYSSSDTIIYFIIVFAVVDSIVTLIFSFILNLFV